MTRALPGLRLAACLLAVATGAARADAAPDVLEHGLALVASGHVGEARAFAAARRPSDALAGVIDAAADASQRHWPPAAARAGQALQGLSPACRGDAKGTPCADVALAWEATRLLAEADLARGLAGSARERATRALALATDAADARRRAASLALLARVAWAEGDAAQAGARLADAQGAAQALPADPAFELDAATLLVAIGAPDGVTAAALQAARHDTDARTQVRLALLEARLAAAAGRSHESASALTDAVQRHAIENAGFDLQLTRAVLAVADGDPAAALSTLDALDAPLAAEGDLTTRIAALREVADALERRQDFHDALGLQDRVLRLMIQAMHDDHEDTVRRLQARHDRGASPVRLAESERDNVLEATRLRDQGLHRQLWLLATATALLVVAVASTLYWRTRRSWRRLAALEETLHCLGRVDPLTGLANRRAFRERVEPFLDRDAGGERFCGALLLVDLDHFKAINDGHGHDVGDRVLAETARRLAGLVEAPGLATRWGGEEFLVLLPPGPPAELRALARRALVAMAGAPVSLGGERSIRVTGSIGFACFEATPAAARVTLADAITLVDLALGRAKLRGRDRAIGVAPGSAAIGDLVADFDAAVGDGRIALDEILAPPQARPEPSAQAALANSIAPATSGPTGDSAPAANSHG